MPRRFERHARSAWEWGTPGSRSSELARAVSDDPAAKAPGKKDRDLCKAAHWRGPHQPGLRMREYSWRRPAACLWAVSWRSKDGEPSWHCGHEEVCTGCGKILRLSVGDRDCPDYHAITAGEREAIEAERAEDEARVAAARARNRRQPRPPVTGKRGFRRKRD